MTRAFSKPADSGQTFDEAPFDWWSVSNVPRNSLTCLPGWLCMPLRCFETDFVTSFDLGSSTTASKFGMARMADRSRTIPLYASTFSLKASP